MAYLGDGSNPVNSYTSGSATVTIISTNVTATVAAQIAPINLTRRNVVVYNETGTLYVACGPAASDSNYTYRLTANTFTPPIEGYTGILTAIKSSGTTPVRVTDIG